MFSPNAIINIFFSIKCNKIFMMQYFSAILNCNKKRVLQNEKKRECGKWAATTKKKELNNKKKCTKTFNNSEKCTLKNYY